MSRFLFLNPCINNTIALENITDQQKNYKIGSGDILNIVTWKEPDFSREQVLVRIDGNISFPLVNDVPAAGRTPMQLKAEIEKGLKEFIENPVVTVTITRPESQKFYILGEVANTGEYKQSYTDLTLPGVGPSLRIVRTYSSLDWSNTLFGRSWIFNLGRQLIIAQDENGEKILIVRLETGERNYFKELSDGTIERITDYGVSYTLKILENLPFVYSLYI